MTTVAAVILVPVVLAYQTWPFRVFRRRVTAESASAGAQPGAAGAAAVAAGPSDGSAYR